MASPGPPMTDTRLTAVSLKGAAVFLCPGAFGRDHRLTGSLQWEED